MVYQACFTTKGHDTGTGIGLYMSNTIIEEHFYGVITVLNSADGAEFTASIPCAKDGV
jgi:signal transduction histidine kinase